jgi:glycosyltransferase involved in cell wall biosynthesis
MVKEYVRKPGRPTVGTTMRLPSIVSLLSLHLSALVLVCLFLPNVQSLPSKAATLKSHPYTDGGTLRPARSLEGQRSLCFHVSSMPARGATRAIYDYARYVQKYYGDFIRPIIIHPEYVSLATYYPQFLKQFGLQAMHAYTLDPTENYSWFGMNQSVGGVHMKRLIESLPCDGLYVLKHGSRASHPRFPVSFSDKVPSFIHSVFAVEAHGSHKLLPLNGFLTDVNEREVFDHGGSVLPHIVNPPPAFSRRIMNGVLKLKSSLSIPADENSMVLCGFGGFDSFSVVQAIEAVIQLALKFSRKQLNFIFMGMNPFTEYFGHDKFIFHQEAVRRKYGIHILSSTSDDEEIEIFLQSCDAMLHARLLGETFGLAVAEFSIRNKPVLTFIDPLLRTHSAEHIRILSSEGFYYATADDVVRIVSNWMTNGVSHGASKVYQQYLPEHVMKQFKTLVLDPIFNISIGSSSVDHTSETCQAGVDDSESSRTGVMRKAKLPCKSPQCEVSCSTSLACFVDKLEMTECDRYLSAFQPPRPLQCNLKSLSFHDSLSAPRQDLTVSFIPVGFVVHADDILSCVPEKVFDFAISDPQNYSSYIYGYGDEPLYRRNMAHSYYSMTNKKAGWDCMRHYEIIASGSVPYFMDLENCPAHTLPFFPRPMLLRGRRIADEARSMYDNLNRTRALNKNSFNDSAYGTLACCLNRFATKYLTSTFLAKYALDVTDNSHVQTVLIMLSDVPQRYFDYLAFAILHGMRVHLGVANVAHFPSDPLLYEVDPHDEPFRELKDRQIWGKGYSWGHRLVRERAEVEYQEHEVVRGISEHRWDMVIYVSVHRSMPLWNLVRQHYSRKEVIFIDGEDYALSDHAFLEANYFPEQWPPFNMQWRDLAQHGHYFKRELGDECPYDTFSDKSKVTLDYVDNLKRLL